MLLVASLKPTTPAATPTWLHVDLTQPRSPDGPAQAVATKALAGGDAVVPMHRTYQVSWVHGTWTGNTAHPHVESGVSPPSDPIVVGTTAGAEVTLPAWKDPKDLALVPGTPPEQVVAWRVYRTAGGRTEAGGDTYLVAEVPAKKTTTGQTVPAKTWTDTAPDTTLTAPLLSELKVDFRHTSDSKGTKLLDGFANLNGVLDQSSYQEAGDGTPAFTGQRIEIHLQGAPGGALVGYTTRPTAGAPRVTWASRSPAGDTGVGSGHVTITPTGVAATTDSAIDALVSSVPARFGALWSQRGTDRVRIEVGSETDTGQPLANGIGMVAGQSAQILPDPTVPSARRDRRRHHGRGPRVHRSRPASAATPVRPPATNGRATRGGRRWRRRRGRARLVAGEPATVPASTTGHGRQRRNQPTRRSGRRPPRCHRARPPSRQSLPRARRDADTAHRDDRRPHPPRRRPEPGAGRPRTRLARGRAAPRRRQRRDPRHGRAPRPLGRQRAGDGRPERQPARPAPRSARPLGWARNGRSTWFRRRCPPPRP